MILIGGLVFVGAGSIMRMILPVDSLDLLRVIDGADFQETLSFNC